MEARILRRREVERLTSLSKSTLYRLARQSSSGFPMPIRLGPRAVGWLKEEIDEWIATRQRAETHSTDS